MLQYDAAMNAYTGRQYRVEADVFDEILAGWVAGGFAPAVARQRLLDEREWAADRPGVARLCVRCGGVVPISLLGEVYCGPDCAAKSSAQ